MSTAIQNYFLKETESIWKSLSENMQPASIWIAEYDSVPNNYYGQMIDNKLLLNVWFLEKNNISKKDLMEFKRFMSVHSMFEGLMFPKKENSRILEIGLAEFAKFENQSDTYYFDYHFGGFCAAGFRVVFNDFGELITKEGIWIS